jgi:hypothetical protein
VHTGINRRDVVRAAGFQQDSAVGIGQHRHQRQDIWLQQRFATGDLNQRAVVGQNVVNNFA